MPLAASFLATDSRNWIIKLATMRHEGDPPEEERPRPRPRVVDKRVSSREAREEAERAPEPPTPPQEAERLAQQLSEVSSRDWVVNTAVTLANVGAAKIDRGLLEDSRLAIDALSALINAVGPSLGEAENPLRQTLAQLQFAYAQGMQPPPAQPS